MHGNNAGGRTGEIAKNCGALWDEKIANRRLDGGPREWMQLGGGGVGPPRGGGAGGPPLGGGGVPPDLGGERANLGGGGYVLENGFGGAGVMLLQPACAKGGAQKSEKGGNPIRSLQETCHHVDLQGRQLRVYELEKTLKEWIHPHYHTGEKFEKDILKV